MSRFGKVICLSGPNAGQEYELIGDFITIGRAEDSSIVLEDHFASRHHAEIRRIDNSYQIHDLNSKNSLSVNGRQLSKGGTAWLEDGFELQLASTRFRFHDPSATLTAPSLMAVQEPALRVDASTRQVYVDGQLIRPPLSVKQFDLLWYLYQNRGRVVSKDEIAQAVWFGADGDVYDANIDRMVSRVRKRINPDKSKGSRFISTVRGYGYQLKLI